MVFCTSFIYFWSYFLDDINILCLYDKTRWLCLYGKTRYRVRVKQTVLMPRSTRPDSNSRTGEGLPEGGDPKRAAQNSNDLQWGSVLLWVLAKLVEFWKGLKFRQEGRECARILHGALRPSPVASPKPCDGGLLEAPDQNARPATFPNRDFGPVRPNKRYGTFRSSPLH
jgi:hypothetical protein